MKKKKIQNLRQNLSFIGVHAHWKTQKPGSDLLEWCTAVRSNKLLLTRLTVIHPPGIPRHTTDPMAARLSVLKQMSVKLWLYVYNGTLC